MEKELIQKTKISKNKKDTKKKIYPLKRGFVGHFGYFLGMFLTRLGVKLRATGRENIPAEGPYILAPNHVTFVDGLWVASYLPRGHFKRLCSMTAKDLEDSYGAFGRLIVRVGRGIAADRFGNPIRSLILAKQELDKGAILLLHPEGTRSDDGELGEFKSGAGYLAIKAACPVLPVYIEGGFEVFSRHMKFPKPFKKGLKKKRITIHFGKPVNPQKDSTPDSITEDIKKEIENLQKAALSEAESNQ